jgi:hypothetical protein
MQTIVEGLTAQEVAKDILDCFYQFEKDADNSDDVLFSKISHLRELMKANPELACRVKEQIFLHFAEKINQLCDQYERIMPE